MDIFTETFNEIFPKKEFTKNSVYINEHVRILISPKDGVRWILVGDSGSGKTYAFAILSNQFKNVIHFDPTSKFRDTLKEIGLEDDWEYYILTPKDDKHAFRINVRDLDSRILDSLFPRTEDTKKKKLQRQAVEQFLIENTITPKTYAQFNEMCVQYELESIQKDLDWILSKKDDSPPINFWSQGKKVIECESLSIKNSCIGVFLQAFIGSRSKLNKTEVLNPQNFVLISLDEAQNRCKYATPVGNAYATVNTEARKYGVGEMLIGAGYNEFHPDVRANWNMSFVFNSKGLTKKYRGEGMDLIMDDMIRLESHKYHCFMFSKDGKYNRKLVKPNSFFKEIREKKKSPTLLVEEDETEFELNLLTRM